MKRHVYDNCMQMKSQNHFGPAYRLTKYVHQRTTVVLLKAGAHFMPITMQYLYIMMHKGI